MALAALLHWLVPVVLAQTPPDVPCAGLPGCTGAANFVLLEVTLPAVVMLLLRVMAGLAVLFVIVAGFRIMSAMGDEEKETSARMAIVYALTGLGVASISQNIVGFVLTEQSLATVTDEVSLFAVIVNVFLTVMNGLLLVMIGYASIMMIIARGNTDKFNKSKRIVIQCIIGAIIVNFSNTFVQILAGFFGV
jgi:hypothetical protein